MPQDHAEAIRGVYAGWSKGDFAAGVELFDPHYLFVLPPEFADAGTYLGLEQVANYMRGPARTLGCASRSRPTRSSARGDSVVASVIQRGTGGGSGATTELRFFQVWTFRGDRVICLEHVRERGRPGRVGLPSDA